MRLAVTALVLLLSAASQAAEPILPDFIPPGTNLVIGFSLRGLADSPLLKTYADQAKLMSADYLKGSPLAGLDPLRDIDDLIIATAGGEKAPTLIVLHGRFDLEKLGAGAKRYHDLPIFDDAKSSKGVLALLDAGTAIAGERAQVRAAIDRLGKGVPPPAALMERVQAMQSRFDIWGLGDVPKGISSPGAAASPELRAIDRFEFGASLRHGLDLTGQFHVRSSKDSEKILATMQLLGAMIKLQAPPSSGARFDLQSDENHDVKVSIFIPEEELKKGIQARMGSVDTWLKADARAPKRMATPLPAYVSPKAGVVKNDQGDAVIVTLPGGR